MQTTKPIIPIDTRFSTLECEKAFNTLTQKQQLYAYYFTRASWQGSKICYFQRSYESPALLYIFLKAFSSEAPKQFFERTKSEFGEDTLKKVFVYLANFLGNCGNYKSFGDSKFIPEVSTQVFQQVLLKSKYWSEHQKQFKQIYSDIQQLLFKYQTPYALINFSDQQGTTGYYSKNISLADAQKVKGYLQQFGILSQNNRVIKVNDNSYIVRIASANKQQKTVTTKEGVQIKLQYGDFSPFLQSLNDNLQKALAYTANQNQTEMVKSYIQHFKGGDVNKHKQSQIHWVKDKGPSVETNIGFIESYLDPLKVRAQFEGFVAIVNKQQSTILNQLVTLAEKIITDLPWGKDFEVQQFKKPDFTSLQVLAFASSGIPVGINIPNYDEIREHHGFKNVNLGNAYGTPTKQSIAYIPDEQADLQLKYHNPSLFLIVALHQLLGHGTGRLMHQLPAFGNPLEYQFSTYYKQGDTWHSVFGDIASGYEECRADGVALYLSTYKQVRALLLPKYSQEQQLEIMYASWYELMQSAVRGLEYYDKQGDRWTQAHIAASFALFKVLVEQGGLVEIKQEIKDGQLSIKVHLNKDQILTKGKKAIGNFLRHLQIYKSTADCVRGEAFFKKYLQVDEKLLAYRDLVIKNKKPRRIEVQPDVELIDNKVIYKTFEANIFSALDSNLFHFRFNNEDILEQWKLNSPFKY